MVCTTEFEFTLKMYSKCSFLGPEIETLESCVDILNLENLISISNVDTLKFEDQCWISQQKLSLQGMTITGYRRGNKLIRRWINMEINA